MILEQWEARVAQYDEGQNAQRYNNAYAVMMGANQENILDEAFLHSIVAFLIEFDMQRFLGQNPHDMDAPGSFINRLHAKLEILQPQFEHIRNEANMPDQSVRHVYTVLAEAGANGLDARNRTDPRRRAFRFDVGATKIMHAICPNKLIILDRYVAFALRGNYPNPPWHYHNNPPIGHSVDKYCRGLALATDEVNQVFGNAIWAEGIRGQSPLRAFDKCAWIVGQN